MKKNRILIFDFDSTFITVESLDLLADIVLGSRKNKHQILTQIHTITTRGMEGKISFAESLAQRFALFAPDKTHIEKLAKILEGKISPSILRNRAYFMKNREFIYIVSGGFKEYMSPVLEKYGILPDHILGNTFLFDTAGKAIDYDSTSPLTLEKGKVAVIRQLELSGDIYMVGDGYTDYQVKEAGLVKKFIAYTENISRSIVVQKADAVAKNFEEVLSFL